MGGALRRCRLSRPDVRVAWTDAMRTTVAARAARPGAEGRGARRGVRDAAGGGGPPGGGRWRCGRARVVAAPPRPRPPAMAMAMPRPPRVPGGAVRDDITRMLHSWRDGDDTAREALFTAVYGVLHGMAMARTRDRGDLTLRPTALVHDAVLRLLGADIGYADRAHFFALVAAKMRAVLVDHARARAAAKRGGGALNLTLSQADAAASGDDAGAEVEVLALHQALERLGRRDPRAAAAVEMAYFGGMSQQEIALVLGVSLPTVERDLRFARAWLNRQLA